MPTINVTAAGPIEGTFTIDLSPGPGVYEFRGARGTGKTTCISTIDWLAGHKVDVTLHDGALSGHVTGFGVVAPIGGRKRRKGDFELDTLDAEKFALSDILDPQGKTPEVRDATRIKALAVLSGMRADPQLYYALAGGQAQFDALGITRTDDPVMLATRIKAAFDAEAKRCVNRAQTEAQHAAVMEHVPADLDLNRESDLAVLGHDRDHARDKLQQLQSERNAGIAKEQEIAKAKERLQAIQDAYNGPTVNDADSARQQTGEKEQAAAAHVKELEDQLSQARMTFHETAQAAAAAVNVWMAAKSHAMAVEELQAIACQTVTYPEESAIVQASKAVDSATASYNMGVRIRDVRWNQIIANGHRKAEESAWQDANNARNQAAQVFDVLAKSLRTTHLEITSVDGNPRLFVQHPKRGRCAFDAVNGLSDGERVDVTLREVLPHLGSPGLLPIPQRVWQDLQPADRTNLHRLAIEKGLYIFGAQVDDGELRVVFWGRDESNRAREE